MDVQPGTLISKNPKIVQNKAIRFAPHLSPRTHVDITYFLKMQWLALPVDVTVAQLNLGIMHKIVHSGALCSYRTQSFWYGKFGG